MSNDMALDDVPDDVEGTDVAPSDGWGEYPLDSVFVRSEIRTVGDAVKRISNGRYVMDPDFQRDFVWDEEKQSKLIESCMMRIPLPVFYVAEAKDGRVIVVDGLQRLTTFARFMAGDLKLILGSVEKPHPLAGQYYSRLPLNLQERIDDTQLTFYILDSKAPERARLDIFERVNSGVPLTRQQMRNALHNGRATEWLKSASLSPLFREATGNSLSRKTMRDREAINRFCAFELLGWSRYAGGDMDGFLAQALELMNAMSNEELSLLRERFARSLKTNLLLFGRHAFRKSIAEEDAGAPRSIVNIALFDVCSVLFANIIPAPDSRAHDELRGTIVNLLHDPAFRHDITYSTNSTLQVRGRFVAAELAFGEYLSR